jgi:hypothetical protein
MLYIIITDFRSLQYIESVWPLLCNGECRLAEKMPNNSCGLWPKHRLAENMPDFFFLGHHSPFHTGLLAKSQTLWMTIQWQVFTAVYRALIMRFLHGVVMN